MKRIAAFVFFVAFLAAGCAEDKKTAIPTKLDQPLPQAATAGGGAQVKSKAPGGSTTAE